VRQAFEVALHTGQSKFTEQPKPDGGDVWGALGELAEARQARRLGLDAAEVLELGHARIRVDQGEDVLRHMKGLEVRERADAEGCSRGVVVVPRIR
jgi:hypothetical protein